MAIIPPLKGNGPLRPGGKILPLASIFLLACLIICLPASSGAYVDDGLDHRAFIHGVNLVRLASGPRVFFSSNGYPPKDLYGDWYHDIYSAPVNLNSPPSSYSKFVVYNEAQEPASVAVNSSGKILITCEDGSDGINQFYSLYDSNLAVLKAYPQNAMWGGHSGQAAAAGEDFLVAVCEGWIDSGGVDDLGTGDDIWARPVTPDGVAGKLIRISVGSTHREWWPRVAGSPTNWLVTWQRYVEGSGSCGGTLHGALVSKSGAVTTLPTLAEGINYYHHWVVYLPGPDLFAVAMARESDGILLLINRQGTVVDRVEGLPPIVREAGLTFLTEGSITWLVYPAQPNLMAVLKVESNQADYMYALSAPYTWDYVGVAGLFNGRNKVLWAAGGLRGLTWVEFTLSLPQPPESDPDPTPPPSDPEPTPPPSDPEPTPPPSNPDPTPPPSNPDPTPPPSNPDPTPTPPPEVTPTPVPPNPPGSSGGDPTVGPGDKNFDWSNFLPAIMANTLN